MRAFHFVIARGAAPRWSAAKDLIAPCHRRGNRHEILHFVQDDRRAARDDKRRARDDKEGLR